MFQVIVGCDFIKKKQNSCDYKIKYENGENNLPTQMECPRKPDSFLLNWCKLDAYMYTINWITTE